MDKELESCLNPPGTTNNNPLLENTQKSIRCNNDTTVIYLFYNFETEKFNTFHSK